MPAFLPLVSLILLLGLFSCKEKTTNQAPAVSVLTYEMTGYDPATFRFTVTASDPDFDLLTYTWAFGEGTVREGTDKETFSYPNAGTYPVKVTVNDEEGASASHTVTIVVETEPVVVQVNPAVTFQTIEGFGGFGAQNVYWSNGPFTSPAFVELLINDLGLTMLRDNIPPTLEIQNDNNDPDSLNLAGFNLTLSPAGNDEAMSRHLDYLRDMHAAGLEHLIATVWSPPFWMKHNNQRGNGTENQNSAPAYIQSPTSATNQLRTDMYAEFAEFCVAYITLIRQETGIEVYALSIQNEPRFSQFYSSCVYDGPAMRDLLKVVGARLEREGLATRLFVPEDVGWFDGANGFAQAILADPDARKYVDRFATHGYAFDGITAGSADAATWQAMYNWGAPYSIPLWMTETSGFEESWDGALDLAQAMYVGLKFGNVSAWVHWSLAGDVPDAYTLIGTRNGTMSPGFKYYASKHFYRFVRPGAVRTGCESDKADLLSLAFSHPDGSKTLVLVNTSTKGRRVTVQGLTPTEGWQVWRSSAWEKCVKLPASASLTLGIVIPPQGMVTLYLP